MKTKKRKIVAGILAMLVLTTSVLPSMGTEAASSKNTGNTVGAGNAAEYETDILEVTETTGGSDLQAHRQMLCLSHDRTDVKDNSFAGQKVQLTYNKTYVMEYKYYVAYGTVNTSVDWRVKHVADDGTVSYPWGATSAASSVVGDTGGTDSGYRIAKYEFKNLNFTDDVTVGFQFTAESVLYIADVKLYATDAPDVNLWKDLVKGEGDVVVSKASYRDELFAVKLSNGSPVKARLLVKNYGTIRALLQQVELEANTTYVYSINTTGGYPTSGIYGPNFDSSGTWQHVAPGENASTMTQTSPTSAKESELMSADVYGQSQTYTYQFTTSKAGKYTMGVQFQPSTQVYIDNLSLTKSGNSTNLLKNTDFSQGLDYWEFKWGACFRLTEESNLRNGPYVGFGYREYTEENEFSLSIVNNGLNLYRDDSSFTDGTSWADGQTLADNSSMSYATGSFVNNNPITGQAEPVANANIRLKSDDLTFDCSTNAAGNFFFGNIKAGTYSLYLMEEGKAIYLNKEYTFEANKGYKISVQFTPNHKTCSVCNTTYLGTGDCDACQGTGAKVLGYALLIREDIGVRYYVAMTSAARNSNNYLEFSVNGKSSRIAATDAEAVTVNGTACYAFDVDMFALQMADKIQARFVVAGGATAEYESYSVKDYSADLLAGDYAYRAKAMMKAMLNYGSMSQSYFDYRVDAPANDNLSDAQQVLQDNETNYQNYAPSLTDESGMYWATSLLLRSKTGLRHYIHYDESASISVTSGGQEVDFVRGENTSGTYIEIPDIKAYDLDKSYDVTVTQGENTMTLTGYSILSYGYCTLQSELLREDVTTMNLINSLYSYWVAAKQYADAKMIKLTVTSATQNHNFLQLTRLENGKTYELSFEAATPEDNFTYHLSRRHAAVEIRSYDSSAGYYSKKNMTFKLNEMEINEETGNYRIKFTWTGETADDYAIGLTFPWTTSYTLYLANFRLCKESSDINILKNNGLEHTLLGWRSEWGKEVTDPTQTSFSHVNVVADLVDYDETKFVSGS
ncbi:MAG: hypothetical protein UHS49_00045 [Faecalimonas sp.]|nr:hypothetical protein [Faecalimonas sp.]